MARRADILIAFIASLKQDARGSRCVETRDFLRELAKRNHVWTRQQANEWIMRYQTFFREKQYRDGDDKIFHLTNMGYVRSV